MRHGIQLWLDVSRQIAARGEHDLAPLRSWNDAPDILFDGSAKGNHLTQPVAAARPQFRIDWGTTSLAFDGKNDFLHGLLRHGGDDSRAMDGLTLFVVASPHETGGGRSLFGFNRFGRDDATSGMFLGFGDGESAEGRGLEGMDLGGAAFGDVAKISLNRPRAASQWEVFTINLHGEENTWEILLNGEAIGTGPLSPGKLAPFEEFTLGGRRYSADQDRPQTKGYFKGWLTEVLMYDRSLTTVERRSVEEYLNGKYGSVLHGLKVVEERVAAGADKKAATKSDVQVHFPGFEVQELPVDLPSINSLRYDNNGHLMALGYDGRIWRLRDTDEDGLEDLAEIYFDGRGALRAPVGLAVTPPGFDHGSGVLVAAKDRVVLVLDSDGDGVGDTVKTIATWTEESEQKGVDALGIAVGSDGSIYFCLGAASFTDPFLVDKVTGKARYHTGMERGTIQRILPDLSGRETVATGIRFAVGMAFDRHGELFVTDQEGATWRHDGNPLDELLHIRRGRHYGFPPRHPVHLPDVFDEPSTFDYAPQHQSTCGLIFNDPVLGGPTLGPAHWSGDAFVFGYSRGKIWRTRMEHTGFGPVARTHLLATMDALAVDGCISPRGDLIVAAHGGRPDWGGGPNAPGRLWRLREVVPEVSRPVEAWLQDPEHLLISFDRSIAPAVSADWLSRIQLESGPMVFPGDRFETIRPGYQIVYDQLAAPRLKFSPISSTLRESGRELVLKIPPMRNLENIAITLPSFSPNGEVSDLMATRHGIEVAWDRGSPGRRDTLWWPHIDPKVTRHLTQGSAPHEKLLNAVADGTDEIRQLVLRAQLDLWEMLQPAIQPGSAIDWVRPPEVIRVRVASDRPFTLKWGDGAAVGPLGADDNWVETEFRNPGRVWKPFELRLSSEHGKGIPRIDMTWSTDEDPRPRPFPLRRFILPWVVQNMEELRAGLVNETGIAREALTGDWHRGRELFFSEQLACARCHVLRGEGAALGPDLSNLIHRDLVSVQRDIEFPNAALNPDHLASWIEIRGLDPVAGIILNERDGMIQYATAAGEIANVPVASILSIEPASLSLMPEGLWQLMSSEAQKDLMTYLMRSEP